MTLRSDWLNVAVTDAKTRRQVIDLRRPVGAESTPPARPKAIEEVVRLRQPVIGGVQIPGEGGEPFVLFSVPVLRDGEEIGRASCRESVCQYVSISVVAVSLQTKTIHKLHINKQSET